MARHFVPLHPVLNHQCQGLGMVDDLQEGEDGHVLHVAVVDTAADGHQGLQPQREAGIASCSEGKGQKGFETTSGLGSYSQKSFHQGPRTKMTAQIPLSC